MKRHFIILLLIASLLQAGEPLVITKDSAATFYREFKRLTKEPHYVSPRFWLSCVGLSKDDLAKERAITGPHTAVAVHIFANASAADSIAANVAEFPVGAVIVKEKLRSGNGPDNLGQLVVGGIGGMVKRAKGYDPANGDWEFFYYTPGGEFTTGKLANCVDCHTGAKRDHIFIAWNLSRTPNGLETRIAYDEQIASPSPTPSRSSASQNPTQIRSVREALLTSWKQVQAIDHPLLANVSDAKPSFDEDAQGIRGARVSFIKNAVWSPKAAGPGPIDPHQPYLWVTADVWGKGLPAQPSTKTRSLRVGDTDYALEVRVVSSDPALASRVESILLRAFGKSVEPAASGQPLPPPSPPAL